MKREDISTFQSAVQLDRVHNEGKLLKALQGEHITKEEMIASIFNIVQKKNAQQETQKLLSNIASKEDELFTDYWQKEESKWKDKIVNKLFFNREGDLDFENIKSVGIGAIAAIGIIIIIIRIVITYFKNRFKSISKRKNKNMRNRQAKIINKGRYHEQLMDAYKTRTMSNKKIFTI